MTRKKFLEQILFLGVVLSLSTNRFFTYCTYKRLFFNKVIFMWSGAVTSSSIKVNAKLSTSTAKARLIFSTDPNLKNPQYSPLAAVNIENNYIVRFTIDSLIPDTQYFYTIESDGIVDNSVDAIGKFRTLKNTAQSFKFSVASCCKDSDHPIFLRIKEKKPLFHLVHGDLHYRNPNSATDIDVHRAPLEKTLAKTAINDLIRNYPIVYMWDDHDYCGNGSNSFSLGKKNARLVYQEYVPHFPLVAGAGNVPIYQSFTIGRMKFIMTDLRSERGAAGTSMLGTVQKAWFKDECLKAIRDNQIIIWVSSASWGAAKDISWGLYASERTELSDFFKSNEVRNMIIICGDAHMFAIDNGSNHDFSTGANNPFKYPVLQAGAANQKGTYKGGTFSEGYYTNPDRSYGQFATVEILDTNEDRVMITFKGYRVTDTGEESLLRNVTYNFLLNKSIPILL